MDNKIFETVPELKSHELMITFAEPSKDALEELLDEIRQSLNPENEFEELKKLCQESED